MSNEKLFEEAMKDLDHVMGLMKRSKKISKLINRNFKDQIVLQTDLKLVSEVANDLKEKIDNGEKGLVLRLAGTVNKIDEIQITIHENQKAVMELVSEFNMIQMELIGLPINEIIKEIDN